MTTVREQLRFDFQNNIRYIFVKDECEYCGSKEELHLHHEDKRFVKCAEETSKFVEFSLDTDIECIDEFELEKIRNIMLGIQLRVKYKTLCKTCHMEEHKYERGNTHLLMAIALKKKREKENRNRYVENELPTHLENMSNIRYYGKDREEIIKIIDLRDKKNRIIKSARILNEFLHKNKIKYEIISKMDNNRVVSDGVKNIHYKKTYWIIVERH